jgi:hypothetical protein
VNREINPAVEDCLVNFLFKDPFLVEREERCSLVRITPGRDDCPAYSQTRIQLSNTIYD